MADTQPAAPAPSPSAPPTGPAPTTTSPTAPPKAPATPTPAPTNSPTAPPAAPSGPPTKSPVAPSTEPERLDYASPLYRLLARLLDGVLIGVIGGVLAGVVLMAIIIITNVVGGINAPSTSVFSALVIFVVYFFAILMFLVNVLLTAKTGQSMGKKAIKIKVVKRGGNDAPGLMGAILREVVGAVANGLVLYIGYLWMFFDKNKQTWADKIANTVVVKV